ncbi:MAG: hypothetical protein AAF614_32690 [Chloroflexota bacterium]
MANWRLGIEPSSTQSPASIRQSLWFWGASLLLVVVTAVPYLLGYLTTPADTTYTHLLMNPEDAQSYFAKMQQGYAGSWVYTIPFTAEQHEASFVGGFYLFLGHLARWLGIGLTAVWHLSRLFFATLLFLTLPPFIHHFLPDRRSQKSAFLLAAFSSGFGWLLFLLQQPYWLGSFPIEFKQPEAHLFFTAMTFPHMAWATTLLLWYVGNVADLMQTSSWKVLEGSVQQQSASRKIRYGLVGGLTAVLLGITAPFLVYLLIGITILTGIWLVFWQKRPFLPTAIYLASPLACVAPLFLYYAYVLQTNAAFRLWDEQALTPTAPWPHYVVAYGLFIGLALTVRLRQSSPESSQATDAVSTHNSKSIFLLWIWLLTAVFLLFMPLNQPRRFVQGVDVPLAILVTLSLKAAVWPRIQEASWFQRLIANPRYTQAGMRRLLFLGFLGFVGLSTFYLWASVAVTAAFQQPDPLFRPSDEQTAVLWLREAAPPNALVLGDYQTGSFVAGQGGQRVVLGHWAETGNFVKTETAVSQFFQANTDDTWRQDYVQRWQIDYVWHGPREQALGEFEPGKVGYLTAVYQNETITIYQTE